MTEYNNGGVIPGESVPVRVELGERLIKPDGTVYELTAGGLSGKGYAAWMGEPDA